MKKLLVVLASIAFLVAFTAPAMSADWSFYGSSRMSTFFDSDDDQASDKRSADLAPMASGQRAGIKRQHVSFARFLDVVSRRRTTIHIHLLDLYGYRFHIGGALYLDGRIAY